MVGCAIRKGLGRTLIGAVGLFEVALGWHVVGSEPLPWAPSSTPTVVEISASADPAAPVLERLERARVLHRDGFYLAAAHTAANAAEQAELLAVADLKAEASLVEGQAWLALRDTERARRSLRAAAFLADQIGSDRVAALAASWLVHAYLAGARENAQAQLWGRHAEQVARRLDPEVEVEDSLVRARQALAAAS